jgi:hypothetical protein
VSWISFLSIHERRDTITRLGIHGCPEEDSSQEVSRMFVNFINQVPNVDHLTLKGGAVVPSLQGLSDSKNVPSGIVTVNLCECQDVKEDLIFAFLQAFYTKKREPLSLEIFNCASISEDAKQRLDLAHDELKKTKAKKNRKPNA